tara:strand:- start:3049 stop:3879 length:831 start_codon:yes stop_codon:yes gene_type:complete
MAKYKLKLKEAAPNLAQQGNYSVGDITYSKDGDTRFEVDDINDESGQVSWKVSSLPNFDKLYDEVTDAAMTAKGVYTRVKDDEKFREFYEEIKLVRNKIRTHLRKEYPEDYKRMTMNEADVVAPIAKANVMKANNAITNASGVADYLLDVIDQIKDKEQDGIFNNSNIKQAINFLTKAKGVEEMSTSGGAGAYLTPYAFRLKGSKPNIKAYKELGYKEVEESAEQPGEDLGPGPKATEDGVKDSAYVKQFKYQLVPKNKNGTYVQKGSGLEVKKLF